MVGKLSKVAHVYFHGTILSFSTHASADGMADSATSNLSKYDMAKKQQHWSYLEISCDTVHDAAARQATIGSAHGSTRVASMILCQWNVYVLAIGINPCIICPVRHAYAQLGVTCMQILTCGEK